MSVNDQYYINSFNNHSLLTYEMISDCKSDLNEHLGKVTIQYPTGSTSVNHIDGGGGIITTEKAYVGSIFTAPYQSQNTYTISDNTGGTSGWIYSDPKKAPDSNTNWNVIMTSDPFQDIMYKAKQLSNNDLDSMILELIRFKNLAGHNEIGD